MKEFNHTIDKKNEDCELFEDIFELEISTNIKECVIQKEGLKVTGNYFKSNINSTIFSLFFSKAKFKLFFHIYFLNQDLLC